MKIPTKTLFLLLFFYIANLFSQTLNDTLNVSVPIYKSIISNQTNFEAVVDGEYQYNYCDEDADGFIEFNISDIEEKILSQEGLGNNETEATILICTRFGDIIKVTAPFNEGSSISSICDNQLYSIAMSDVAVDEEGEIYNSYFSSVNSIDVATCSVNNLFSFPFGTDINSLSFDTKGNLYYGLGSSSVVYRCDANNLSQPYVWHDFNNGGSGGDFVMLNGKMYIAWTVDDSYRLYEVTVDENINYVSHVDLGEIPDKTYGLASEYGKLYGVTPNRLYKFDFEYSSFVTVLTNNGAYGDWWGAAGLHEAIEFEVSTHLSNADAINSINALPEIWTNTQSGGQIIYVRIDNINTGTYDIYPVTISVGIIPQITTPNDLTLCSSDSNIFDLTLVESELLMNVNQDVEVTYYGSSSDRNNQVNALDTQYESVVPNKIIFVEVKSLNSDCFAKSNFRVITNDVPIINPIVNDPTERMLINCYINNFNQGYFKLDEIYEYIILNEDEEFEVEYYATHSDALEGVHILNSNYISTLGLVEELFIKVINSEGCSTISNFFIDGDCVLTSTDFSNVYFPSFFTPNNDGFHDFWNVKGISNLMRDKTEISIYDRYGKLLYVFSPSQTVGWDGLLNNYNLPSDDYWYQMTTPFNDVFTGHFSLIR